MNGFSVIFTDIHFLRVWPGSAKLEEDEQIHDEFQHRNKHSLFTLGTTMLSIHNSWAWDWWMNACLFVQLLHCQDSPADKSSHTRHVHSSGAVNSCLVRVQGYIRMNH